MALFLKFIKSEEEYFKNRAKDSISEIPPKKLKSKFKKTFITILESSKKENSDKFIWLKNVNFSCRYMIPSFCYMY